MSAYRTLWRRVAAGTVGFGVLGAAGAMSLAEIVGVVVFLGVWGGALGYALSSELKRFRHPVPSGAGLAIGAALVLRGLAHLLGPLALAVVAALLLTSPYVVGLVVGWLRPRISPTDVVRAGSAAPDVALERQWVMSTALLEDASTDEERLLAIQTRAEILDDLTQRGGGRLPDYVWPPPPPQSRRQRGTREE